MQIIVKIRLLFHQLPNNIGYILLLIERLLVVLRKLYCILLFLFLPTANLKFADKVKNYKSTKYNTIKYSVSKYTL